VGTGMDRQPRCANGQYSSAAYVKNTDGCQRVSSSIWREGRLMWKPYEEIRKHPADFRVKYKLFSQEEGGM